MSDTGLDSGLSRYFDTVLSYPLLTAEEEAGLAARWRNHRDLDAAHRLVTSHLRLVVKIAMRHRGYGLALSDLVSEGQIGLLRAAMRFEPGHGCRLATYSVWWIRAAIQEHILRSWSLVRMDTTKAHKRLFFKLRAVKARLQMLDGSDGRGLSSDQAAQIAGVLKVQERDVNRMNGWASGRDQSLNVPLYESGGGDWLDHLVDDTATQETVLAEREEFGQRQAMLRSALDALGTRERDILSARRLRERPLTLQQLGARYGISAERVRQVELRAMEKLRDAVLSFAGRSAVPAM